jgi:hypothetical protein
VNRGVRWHRRGLWLTFWTNLSRWNRPLFNKLDKDFIKTGSGSLLGFNTVWWNNSRKQVGSPETAGCVLDKTEKVIKIGVACVGCQVKPGVWMRNLVPVGSRAFLGPPFASRGRALLARGAFSGRPNSSRGLVGGSLGRLQV